MSKQRPPGSPEAPTPSAFSPVDVLDPEIAAAAVTELLRSLQSGDSLCLLANGRACTYKAAAHAAKNGSSVYCTFRARSDGDFEVHDGLASLNGTFIKSGTLLKAPIVVPEGSAVYFGPGLPPFILPGAKTVKERGSTSDVTFRSLAVALASLRPGELLLVGRSAFPQLPKTLSRTHAQVTRLGDVDGRAHYRIQDGAPSPGGVFVCLPGSATWERVPGAKVCAPGARIRHGERGIEITIPTQKNATTVDSTCGMRLSTYAAATRTPPSFSQASTTSTLSFDTYYDPSRHPLLAPDRALWLGSHISAGLHLMAKRSFKDARIHFEAVEVLADCGFEVVPPLRKQLTTLNAEAVYATLGEVAEHSWSDRKSRRVQPILGEIQESIRRSLLEKQAQLEALPPGFAMGDLHNEMLRARTHVETFNHTLSLHYLEEWLLLCQFALGGCISRKGVLFEWLADARRGWVPDANEVQPFWFDQFKVDVAQFMLEQKVRLSDEYLARYPGRKAIVDLDGFQTDDDASIINQALRICRRGAPLLIGNDLSWAKSDGDMPKNISFLEIPRQQAAVKKSKKSEPDLIKSDRRKRLWRTLQPALITPQYDGTFTVEALRGGVFVQDPAGIFRAVRGAHTVFPGAAVRLGPFFEIELATNEAV